MLFCCDLFRMSSLLFQVKFKSVFYFSYRISFSHLFFFFYYSTLVVLNEKVFGKPKKKKIKDHDRIENKIN